MGNCGGVDFNREKTNRPWLWGDIYQGGFFAELHELLSGHGSYSVLQPAATQCDGDQLTVSGSGLF